MCAQRTERRSISGLVLSILAIVLVVVLIQYGQRAVNRGAPQPLAWLFGVVAVAIVAIRAVARRR